ncbi:hypothetical protein HQ576_17905, partial [bacterium]|nr:hypothetical protein [bacterium]
LYFLHGRVWYNDPAPLYVRPSVPLEQARALASWVALTGQLNASSCDFAELPPERVDILKRTMPSHTLRPRPVDLFEQRIPRIWLLADEEANPPRHVVGLFNWSDAEPARVEEMLARIGLPEAAAYEAFDFWEDEFIDPIAHTLKTTVPAASCRILALRAASDHPQVVSTSRHVTQGVVDLSDEAWDEATQTLRGTSQLVGGDAYELRIVAGTGEEPWQVASVQTSDPAVAASWRQEGRHARVRLEGEAGGEVAWEVCFDDSAG